LIDSYYGTIMNLHLLILFIFLSFAVAQRRDYDYDGGGRDDGGWQERGDYNDDYSVNYDDNNYDNAATNNKRQKGMVNGGGGWGKLLMAGAGGYIIGATFHRGRFGFISKKKYNPKNQNKNKNGTAPPTLRFKVKQRVECNIGDGRTMKGTIIELWHKGKDGQYMPYAIKLDDGTVTYSPLDDDRAIRRVKK